MTLSLARSKSPSALRQFLDLMNTARRVGPKRDHAYLEAARAMVAKRIIYFVEA